MKTVTQTIFGALAALTSSLLLAAVNINTATVDELKSLPGVGSRNGNFKSVEELKQVKGIGDGIFNKLKDEATVAGAPAKANAKAAPIKK